MRVIGVGLVGYGYGNRAFHGPLIRETPGLEVKAIVTASPERQSQAQQHFPQAKIYNSYDELLSDESIGLVVISTPHDTHASLTVKACTQGKHVVVDKIMAMSVSEAEAMLEAARQANVVLSVFQNRRWDSDYLTVKRALEQGLLGEPYVVESSVVGYRKPPATGTPLAWRMQAKHGGGPVRDWGAHLFDQAVQLFSNEIESVYADFQYRWPSIDVETAGICWIRFTSGVRYRIEVGHISKIERPRWYVRGSKGALVIHGRDPQEAALQRGEVISGGNRARMSTADCRLLSDVSNSELDIAAGDYLSYYGNVADALLRGAPLAVTPESVIEALKVIEAAAKSASSGAVITLKPR